MSETAADLLCPDLTCCERCVSFFSSRQVHLANLFGEDKVSFDDRVAFVDRHMDKVRSAGGRGRRSGAVHGNLSRRLLHRLKKEPGRVRQLYEPFFCGRVKPA